MRFATRIRTGCLVFGVAAVLAVSVPSTAATVNWQDSSDFWDVDANWSGGLAPTAVDDAVLNVAGLQTITFSQFAVTVTVNSLSSEENLLIQAGSLTVSNAYTNHADTSLSGGTLILSGASSSFATLSMTGGTLFSSGGATVAGATTLSGGTMLGSGTTAALGPVTSTPGAMFIIDEGRVLELHGGATLNNNVTYLNSATAGSASGILRNLAGSTITDMSDSGSTIHAPDYGNPGDAGSTALFDNQGTYLKTGAGTSSIIVPFTNSGTVEVQNGNLHLQTGVQQSAQGSGTLRISPGGNVNIFVASTVGQLVHNGTGPASLQLNANNVTVLEDYSNANFGSGNAFNRRANVDGTGLILAGGNAAQALSGDNVTNGTIAAPTLTIGNVHVGTTSFAYQVVNASTSGPAIRGAAQTEGNGAGVTDPRLTGSGVTAGDFGPIASGADSGDRTVAFTVNVAGVYTPITGQAVYITNNFDNLVPQLLAITSSPRAAAYNYAEAGLAAPNPVTLPNQRIGGTATQALTISNMAPAGLFTEALAAAFGASAGHATTNGGSVPLLVGAASNNTAMRVGVDTSAAGAKAGTVVINYASNGAGTSGLGITSLPAQTVTIAGNVFRLANSVLNTTSVNLVARLGDAPVSAPISVSNSSPDVYTEHLNASLATLPSGFSGTGAITNLAAGNTSPSALQIALSTATAGTFGGNASVSFVSTGAGTTGAPDFILGVGQVALTGKVYTPATPQVATPTVDFGIVHLGDAVAPKAVSVQNAAPASALNDTLQGSFGGAAGPFAASGNLGSGLAAGASNSTSLTVALVTSSAGVFTGQASANFVSHNPDLPDVSAGSVPVALEAQVNNYAAAALSKASGDGALSQAGAEYRLDFGTFLAGASASSALLSLTNIAVGPADLLNGRFDLSSSSPFQLSGFGAFGDIAAGQSLDNLSIAFAPNTVGIFEDTIVLHSFGTNASGYQDDLGDIQLVLRANVVPEPGSMLLLGCGLALLLLARRRYLAR